MPEIPFVHQWTIKENQLLPLKDSNYGSLRSKSVSNIPEIVYFFELFPNGHRDICRRETWIFLHLAFKDVKKVESDFTFTIESANYSYTDHRVYEKSMGWGSRVCKTDEFFDAEKKFIVDGKFTIKIIGIFKFETKKHAIPAAIEQKWIGGELGDVLWNKEDTKDFIIITSDAKEIKVHKSDLVVRSDVFAAMFNSNMKEAIENKVKIPNFPFIVVETAIKLIYDCNFDSALSIDELMELLQFFDQYQLLALKAKVEPYLIAQISPSTVVRLTNYSVLTNSPKLKEKCMEFLMAAFQSKTLLDDLDELEKDILLEVVKINFYQTLETEK